MIVLFYVITEQPRVDPLYHQNGTMAMDACCVEKLINTESMRSISQLHEFYVCRVRWIACPYRGLVHAR